MSDTRHESVADAVVRIIKQVGLRELMGSDGCECGGVELRGFHIDRSCRKSESSLRVYTNGSDNYGPYLELIATEALVQMRAEDEWSHILVRYCDYTADHFGSGYVEKVWVRGPGACVYCRDPREAHEDYLCAKCLIGEIAPGYPIAAQYNYSTLTPHGLQRGTRDDET